MSLWGRQKPPPQNFGANPKNKWENHITEDLNNFSFYANYFTIWWPTGTEFGTKFYLDGGKDCSPAYWVDGRGGCYWTGRSTSFLGIRTISVKKKSSACFVPGRRDISAIYGTCSNWWTSYRSLGYTPWHSGNICSPAASLLYPSPLDACWF